MKRLLIYICLVVSSAFILACSRSSDTIGPAICPSESFVVTQDLVFKDNAGSTTSLDFSGTSYAKITMDFSEAITYKVTISGGTSGAEYLYEGKGSSIDLNWYGNATNGKSFLIGDYLTCKVTNICKSEALGTGAKYLTLNSIISYNVGPWLKCVNYEDVTSFGSYDNSANIPGSTLTKYVVSSGPGYVASPQGGAYLHAEAQCPSNSYYFGGIGVVPSGFDFTSLGTNPDNVYLNVYVRGESNSQCQLIVAETVFGSPLNRKFLATASADWQLHSIKLRDMGIIDPSKIKSIDFNLGTVTPAQTCSFDTDLILFTFDKPL